MDENTREALPVPGVIELPITELATQALGRTFQLYYAGEISRAALRKSLLKATTQAYVEQRRRDRALR